MSSDTEEHVRATVIAKIASMEDEIVRLAQELIRIPSVNPPGTYAAISAFLARYLRALGFTVEIVEAPEAFLQTHGLEPPRPNVVATYATGHPGPTLIFNGHQDVVPPGSGWTMDPFTGVLKDGKLYGRGATDMKGTIAAMIMSVKALLDAEIPLRGTVKLVLCVDEETGGVAGANYVVAKRGVQGDYCISEGPLDSIKRAWNGAWWFRLTTRGKGAHGSKPWEGVNAIAKMATVVSGLMRLQEELKQRGESSIPGIRYGTLNLGSIQGGKEVNTVCSECTLAVSRRLIPGETLETAQEEVATLLNTLRADDPELTVDLETFFQTEPRALSTTHPLLASAKQATQRVLGTALDATGSTGFIDGRFFMQQGIPTIGLGIQGEGLHGADECADIKQLVQATQIYALITSDLLRQ